MANATPDKYARNTLVSGSVRRLFSSAGSAAITTTIAQYVVGGTSAGRRWRPAATNSVSVNPPSVGTAAAQEGYRVDPTATAYDATNAITLLVGTWTWRLRYLRKGTAVGEVDQSARVTVIVYRMTSAGVFVSEIARGTSAALTFTTTTQTASIVMSGVAAQNFDAGDLAQVEVYVETLLAGVPTAPLTNEDLALATDESEANGGTKLSAPEHNKRYKRTLGPSTVVLLSTLNRHSTLFRSMPASIVLVGTLARQLTLRRVLAAGISLLATERKKVGLPRSASITLLGTRGPLKIRLPRSAGITLVPSMGKVIRKVMSAAITLVSTMARALLLRRVLSASITLVARAWAKLPFNKIPGGGGTTIIRRIINIFED